MAPDPRHTLRIAPLLAALALVVTLIWTASALASVRHCSYRNVTLGPEPYAAQVQTNLVPAAVAGGDVCALVGRIVREVQGFGFDPGALAQVSDAGSSWTLVHRLVYPPGWPAPTGPVQDPHLQVTLYMQDQGGGQAAEAGAAARAGGYWITLNEYT